jgi:trimethylamine--corrinoid protein Co-methyltransferase
VTFSPPEFNFLSDTEVDRIIDRAWTVLERTGVSVEDPSFLRTFESCGFETDGAGRRVHLKNRRRARDLIGSAPGSFRVYGRDDRVGVEIGGGDTVFDPGSAALNWLEPGETFHRKALAGDCVRIAAVTDRLESYRLQSTAVVPSDVPDVVADCARLFFALTWCAKPVITGTFREASFGVMLRMLQAVAGSEQDLRERPLALFDCCPTPPLKLSRLALTNLRDCAVNGVPAQIVSMPMAGATAPVTLIGAVTQHTAETLAALAFHQQAGPGAPVVWGGSGAAFDMHHGTAPMGAMETMLIQIGCAAVGRRLGLPTHVYMVCSDAKVPDYQAGMESGMGAVLAVLGRVNVVSGPGFLIYQNTQSLEKLVLDHDACNLALRLARSIEPHPSVDPADLIDRHAEDGAFLSDPVTRRLHRKELDPPGRTVSRDSLEAWAGSGQGASARTAARSEVRELLGHPPEPLDPGRTSALKRIILEEVRSAAEHQAFADLLDLRPGPGAGGA